MAHGSSSKKRHENLERQKRLAAAIDMEDMCADEAEANAATSVSGAPTAPSETSSKPEPEPTPPQQPEPTCPQKPQTTLPKKQQTLFFFGGGGQFTAHVQFTLTARASEFSSLTSHR